MAGFGWRLGEGAQAMSMRTLIIGVIVVLIAAFVGWKLLAGDKLPAGFASRNGRLEANEA